MEKKNKRITILDVAREAGVTDGTVSRALSGDPRVRRETRRKILETAKKLGYQPNLAARALRQPEGRNLGVFWQSGSWIFHNEYFGSLLSGLADAASQDGVNLVFYLPKVKIPDPNPDQNVLQMTGLSELLDGRVEGAVIFGGRSISEEELSLLREASLPTVFLAPHVERPGFSQVLSGAYERTRLAVGKLLDLGHRKIGVLGLYKGGSHDELTKKAMEDVFRERGLVLKDGWLENFENWNIWDAAKVEKFLKKFLEKKVTAVICVSAEQASLGLEILRRLKVRVPKDLSLVSFGPLSFLAQFQKPELCLMETDLVEAGAQAYELYREARDGKKPRSVTMDWRWTGKGGTVGPRFP